ncbi:MAG: hypothetical protein R3B72_14750 [Polyangiaceae bacterium]
MGDRSLLITFDDEDHLGRVYERELEQGRVSCPGETELAVGERCEVVLVHPETGDSFLLEGKAVKVTEQATEVHFGSTPLLKNQLKKFAGEGGRRDNLQQRLRALPAAGRRRVALAGDLTERVALERIYGKEVWEALLQNNRITMPEVARMARMGTMPKPLLETIVNNPGWVKVPQVRRALLANRRLDGPMIQKVLRLAPRAELELVPKQTAYPMAVRSAAKQMLTGR